MKKFQVLLIINLLLFGLLTNLSAQTTEFIEAKGSGTSELGIFGRWEFSLNGKNYEISEKGIGKKAGNTNAAFRLPLGKNESLSGRVYFTEYRGDLVFLYEASIGGEGIGYIARFDGKTLKLKWRAVVSGFNVGKGLIETQFAYLTAIGFVAKINLVTGKYVWKHDNLYRKFDKNGAFNSFEIPQLEGNNVTFTEKTVYDKINILVVNKMTGKIIRTVLGK